MNPVQSSSSTGGHPPLSVVVSVGLFGATVPAVKLSPDGVLSLSSFRPFLESYAFCLATLAYWRASMAVSPVDLLLRNRAHCSLFDNKGSVGDCHALWSL